VIPDGYSPVPPGRIAAVVTYLELRQPPPLPPPSSAFNIQPLPQPELSRYRALFRAVGEPWLWFSRLLLSDAQLAAIIHHPAVDVFALHHDAGEGLLEIDRRALPEIEIAFLGVTPPLIGRGAGAALLAFAIRHAFSFSPRRLWLHTCTLDHPNALPFYQHFGFLPFRRAIEIAPDPRLTGLLPRTAAPHIPLLP
jgi:GNAT superfamily N-acetyltransferase